MSKDKICIDFSTFFEKKKNRVKRLIVRIFWQLHTE